MDTEKTTCEYCEVDFDGKTTFVYFYDEAGDYIDHPTKHVRLGTQLFKLGHDGWELISTWWRGSNQVTYMLKRPRQQEWTEADRRAAEERYRQNNPRDVRH